MKTPLTALALALSILTGSVVAANAEPMAQRPAFETQLKARYCDKLREGALPYVHFVRRLAPVYGYTYADFAPAYPGAPVIADCGVTPARIAEVRDLLFLASEEAAQPQVAR